jgi:predicted MPP superfamily phosphohydrolase
MPPASLAPGLRGPIGLRRRDLLKGFAAAGIGALAGAGAYGFMYERHRVEITRTTLHVSGWSDGLSGLRIGFLTDLHRSETVSHELITHAVDLLMGERPDLIVLGGDYVTWGNRDFVQPAADALVGLTAPWGVFAILGNHDDDHDMPAALTARGFTVLRDARTQIRVRAEPLDLIGIRYWTRRVEEISRLMRGASPNAILLAHTPSRLFEAASLAVPLVISGHTHGGQIVLPGLGAVAGRRFPVIAGPGKRDNTAIFVSRGVGTVYVPIRLNCPPEVAVLTLQPVPKS